MIQFGVQFQLDFKTILNSASKLKVVKNKTSVKGVWSQFLWTALHTISVQNSFCDSHTTNARWTLPVYPVFEDENSDEKSVKRKIP